MVSTHTERLREISGRHNAVLKELRRAFAHGELTEDGECAIEGLRIVEEAIRSGLRFRAVFFSESGKRLTERLVPQLKANVETLVLPDKLFASAVPSETPQGVAALVRIQERDAGQALGDQRMSRIERLLAQGERPLEGLLCFGVTTQIRI